LKPIGSLAELQVFRRDLDFPKRLLIVWFRGADSSGQAFPDGLDQFDFDLQRDFVARGGALWLATDQPLPTSLSAVFQVSVEGTTILARRQAPSYRDKFECPFLYGVAGAEPDLFRPRGSRESAHVGRPEASLAVATNRPSFLQPSPELRTVGVFREREWRYPSNFSELRDLPVVQAAAYAEGGKILLIADHSIFINWMLLPREPNDNLAFAINCVDWLMQADTGTTRTHVLFMEDGRIWSPADYDLMLRSLPSPTPENIGQFLWDNRHLLWENLDLAEDVLARLEEDGVLAEVESQDLLGQLLADLVNGPSLRRALFILGGILAAGVVIRSALRIRHRFLTAVPRLSTALDRIPSRPDTEPPWLPLVVDSTLRNRWVREQSRRLLARLQNATEPSPDLSSISINASWWQRRRMSAALRRIRHWAFMPATESCTLADLQTLTRHLETLTEWMDRGVFQMASRN
jgi:hypothetical protein